jgi:hypothetical protein
MTHYTGMLRLKAGLEARGLAVIVPKDERALEGKSVPQAARLRFKRRVSAAYFRIIRRRAVFAILVANYPKRGRKNYIGPNSFAEIAIALDARKRIFLLHGIYAGLKDELVAWGAIPLRGNLEALVRAAKKQRG